MRYAATVSSVLFCGMSCDYPPLAKLNLEDAGVVSLTATPSVFILHENDTRDTTLTLTNGTGQIIHVPPELTVSDLVGGTMALSTTCGTQLSAGEHCSAKGHLVATGTGQSNFQVSIGGASAMLSMTVKPACLANCGPGGTSNCCASSVVPGNAPGATNAGDAFFRGYDVATDGAYSNKDAPATVSDFRLDTYEVTVGRFRAFVNAGMGTSGTAPAAGAGAHVQIAGSGWDPTWKDKLKSNATELVAAVNCGTYSTWTDAALGNENLPMNCITWYEATAFCLWDGGYLPTEAEWNYAAAGGTEQRAYPWSSPAGSTSIDCSDAHYGGCAPAGANRVGSESSKGDGRWGQSDLGGSVLEWNLDWFTSNYLAPCNDCANLVPATNRVVRGGGAFVDAAATLRAVSRSYTAPVSRGYGIGVRCARIP